MWPRHPHRPVFTLGTQLLFNHEDSRFQMFSSKAYGQKNLLFKDSTLELVPIATQNYEAWLGREYLHAMKGLLCDPNRESSCPCPCQLNPCLNVTMAGVLYEAYKGRTSTQAAWPVPVVPGGNLSILLLSCLEVWGGSSPIVVWPVEGCKTLQGLGPRSSEPVLELSSPTNSFHNLPLLSFCLMGSGAPSCPDYFSSL